MYEAFKIYLATIEDWRRLLAETGSLKPQYKQTRKRKIDKEKLTEAVKEKPDAYLHELAKQFDCTKQAVFYALEKLNQTYKKILHILGKIRRSKSQRLNKIADSLPENHVFTDECGHGKDYVRTYGRALHGVRVQDIKRRRKFGRTNAVAALYQNTVLAPMCYKHGTNSVFFEEWFENELLPLLKKGQAVTLDNTSFHRKKQLLKILDGTGIHLLFLPAYSSYLNHIQNKWVNLKRALPDILPLYNTLQEAILGFLRD